MGNLCLFCLSDLRINPQWSHRFAFFGLGRRHQGRAGCSVTAAVFNAHAIGAQSAEEMWAHAMKYSVSEVSYTTGHLSYLYFA